VRVIMTEEENGGGLPGAGSAGRARLRRVGMAPTDDPSDRHRLWAEIDQLRRDMALMREAVRQEIDGAKRDARAEVEAAKREVDLVRAEGRAKAEAAEREARLTREEFTTFRERVRTWGAAAVLASPAAYQVLMLALKSWGGSGD
jgi:hypothetical protein